MQASNILNSLVSVSQKIINLKKRKLAAPKYQVNNPLNRNYSNNSSSSATTDKRKVVAGNLFENFNGFVMKVATTVATLGLVDWIRDPKNKDSIVNILKFAKGMFDVASKVAEFGVDSLLSGLSEITSGSLLERMFGVLKAITGFVALKWLIAPLKIFGDVKGFIKFIKDIPGNIQKLSNFAKNVSSAFKTVFNWSVGLSKTFFKGISGVLTKAIVKVFGQSAWNLFKSSVQKTVGGVGKVVGGAAKGITGFAGKFISKSVVRGFGKVLSKIPVIGSFIGFGINLLLGDTIEKAGFKFAASALGGTIGGLLGSLFPPIAPFTAIAGSLLGDFIGDKVFDHFVPPKLATGGIVTHKSTDGTLVIVAEKEDEVVIPLSMLTMGNFAKSGFYDAIKVVGSSILGSIQSVISNMGMLGMSISSSISQFISPLVKLFGVKQYNDTDNTNVSSSNVPGNTQNIINNNNLTDVDILDKILGITQLSKVSVNSNLDNNNDLSIRGLLRGILDVVVNGNLGTSNGGVFSSMIQTAQDIGQQVQSTVKSVFNNIPGINPAGMVASGRATVYSPADVPGDKNAHTTSSGEPYSHTAFTAAAFPELLSKLPKEYTVPTRGDGVFRGNRTVSKPFNVLVKDSTTGRAAIIRINNVGNGNGKGNDGRVIDFTTAPAKYFGGGKVRAADKFGYQIFLAPPNSVPGPITTDNKKPFSDGGVYTYKPTKPQAYGSPRRKRVHAGQDIPISKNGTFQSLLGGSVVYRGYEPGKNKYGNYIDIYNEQRKVVERIAEIGSVRVNVGDTVSPGQIVGSGTSTGVIHYEVRPMEEYKRQYGFKGTTNPIKYLSEQNVVTVANNKFKLNSELLPMDTATTVNSSRIEARNPFVSVSESQMISDVSNINIINVVNHGSNTNIATNVHDYNSVRRLRIPNNRLGKL